MKRQYQFLIGGAIIAAIIGAVIYQSFEQTVFFYTPKEIMAAPADFQGRTIRIGAMVVPNTTEWNADDVLLRFKVTDDNQHVIPVVFAGVKPDMYREGQGVVVEGRIDNMGTFHANNLLVKHSEDYSVADGKSHTNKEAAYRTLVTK